MAIVLRKFIARAPASPDLMIALMLLLAIGMMIMPIPIVAIDILIGLNLGFAVLLLMVAMYVSAPLDFSSLPGVILISTVFRLALTIATTRLILAEGEAGSIIHTFGDFVIAGNIVVGLVIFLVVTIVQFMVLAKGAERVAEVAARFTLDALPGKQMAIDAELKNGHINENEARRRRDVLGRESQFYGAMDGAMKFVKGDSIAGLLVICINMVGGISIGLLTKGMSLGEVVHQYTLLTIGDALISQIPALLISISAATIVTRVGGSAPLNLGADIAHQLTANKRAMRLSAFVLIGMGFVPGFPLPVFFLLAAVFAAASFVKTDVQGDDIATTTAGHAVQPQKQTLPTEARPVVLFLSSSLTHSIDDAEMQQHIARVSELVSADLGIIVPRLPVSLDPQLIGSQFRIDIEGVPVEQDFLDPTQLTLVGDLASIETSRIPFRHDPEAGKIFVEQKHAPSLKASGIDYHHPSELLASRLHATLRRYAPHFVGIQETRELLGRMEQEYADLVKEVLRTTPIPRIADVLRRLLDEGIPIRNTRVVLEALAAWSEREQNADLLAEYVRSGLKRQICHRYADANGMLPAFIIERESENVMRGAISDTTGRSSLVLEDRQSELLLSQMRQIHSSSAPGQTRPVILASMDVRRFIRGFISGHGIDLAVLSYQDLAANFKVRPVGSVKLTA
ncbi:type III secretion system export apparatus subunit SctV [Rhizobium grahamii]|uniref:EscV/YscV/HrcV family type III secretion system export apparatus protein n=1 Tax=Rhizobium grahamii TaxID=1120045 RepID=A0A370KDM6_9HYPH|nr:type III secretion system export apparatus subunit SctV [Rhizobium grahamii]RDJ01007.1 EscV/YscV/HrcV family type III secretion system export apparatus protein [Rhizobium grahamii]